MNILRNETPIFLEKYGELLRSFAFNLRDQNPDYILAMTRKAPRLLELCDYWGINYGVAQIITEKSLELEDIISDGQKGAIIDDIIILGSTLKWLREDYPLLKKVPIFCLIRNTKWCIDEFVEPFHSEATFGQRESAAFCTELVQSIAYLNKPYDLDHPIFYGRLTHEATDHLSSSEFPDKGYEVSTTFHRSICKRRFSFLPEPVVREAVIEAFFKESKKVFPLIIKVRVYYDEVTKQANLVPMLIISAAISDIENGDVAFGDSLNEYNELLRELLKDRSTTRDYLNKYYRLFSYLTSYLYGISFCIRNQVNSSQLPSEFMSTRDLTYLFRPALSRQLLERLDIMYPKTLETLKGLPTLEKELDNPTFSVSSRKSFEDSESEYQNLRNKIKPYLDSNIRGRKFFVDKVACIFEGLFIHEEIPARNRINKTRTLETEERRLAKGFSYDQIRQILMDYNENASEEKVDFDVRLSLAIDILVDNGVAVPFYWEIDGRFERLCRYGEDGLFQRRTGFFLARVFRDLFAHIKQNYGRDNIPKIPFEKILALLQKKLGKTLEDPNNPLQILRTDGKPGETTFDLKLGYCLHGAIVLEEHESKTGGRSSGWLSELCRSEDMKMLEQESVGYRYSNTFLDRLLAEGETDPEDNSMVPDDVSAEYSTLAVALWYLKATADELKKKNKVGVNGDDCLICLSTCFNAESTLNSMQKEIHLLFESESYDRYFQFGQGYSLGEMLKRLQFTLKERKLEKEGLWGRCHDQLLNADQAANEIAKKYRLFNSRSVIVEEVKHIFQRDETLDYYRRDFQRDLGPYIDKMVSLSPHKSVEDAEFKKLLVLGDFCIRICEILKICDSVTESIFYGPRAQEGVLHEHTKRKVKREIEKINSLTPELSKSFDEIKQLFPGKGITNLPKIDIDPSSVEDIIGSSQWTPLFETMVQNISNLWEQIGKIYNQDYTPYQWKEKKKIICPEDTGGSPLKWVIWYDIKDSTGKENPENKVKTPKLKELLNLEFKKGQKNNKDVKFTAEVPSKDDQRFIHAAEVSSIVEFLKILLTVVDGFDMFVRVGVAGVADTGEEFLRISGTDFLESERNFSLPKRIGEYFKSEEDVRELIEYNKITIEPQDIQETYDSHTIVISRQAWADIWKQSYSLEQPLFAWKRVDNEKDYGIYIFSKVPKGCDIYPSIP